MYSEMANKSYSQQMSDILVMTINSLQGECVTMLARRTKHANFRQEYCGMKNYIYPHNINYRRLFAGLHHVQFKMPMLPMLG